MAGSSLELTYNEALDADSDPATSAYSVSVNSGTGTAPSSVDVSGMTVTLTLGTAVTAGQTVTVTYTVPATNPVQDAAGNDAAALTDQAVTNDTNRAPVFADASATRSFAESIGDATVQTPANVGAAITATDADNDTLTYTLEGPGAVFFTIDANGQIKTQVGQNYGYEPSGRTYAVTVKADDNRGGTDTIAVPISLTDEEEKPVAPAPPSVTSTAGSTTSLGVTWTAPANTGRPAITSYDVQYKKPSDLTWTNGPQDVVGTSTSIGSLTHSTDYEVQVWATNDDGDGPWSQTGTGSTNEPANNAPVFPNAGATRSITETVGAATVQTAADIGAPVTATDDDMDTLTYTLEGPDANKFTIDSSGQIRTKVGEAYDRETKASYEVTVKADDSNGGTDTIAVTITVTNVTEFESAFVTTAGTHVNVVFLEDLSATLPNPSAITLTVDGEEAEFRDDCARCPIALGNSDDKRIEIALVNHIRQGQIVTISYEDPTANNDAVAIQDREGNDAVSFTDKAVENRSTLTPIAPDPPTNLTATPNGSNGINLSWEAPVDNGGRVIISYKIEESVDGGATTWTHLEESTDNTDTTYEHTGLDQGTTRYYRVFAINFVAIGTQSNVATTTTPTAGGTPSAPRNLTFTAIGKTHIDLSWDPPAYEGESPVTVTGYKIEASTDSGNNWVDVETDTGNTTTAYEHTGLEPERTYRYRVRAINSAGNGLVAITDDVETFPSTSRTRPRTCARSRAMGR